jgi:arylsulfatase
MTEPFKGVINIDVRNSVPDWTPYEQPKAPDGSPNVLFIVWDDTGFGALEPFGGPIRTPTMQRLADEGLRYTQFHTTSLCSPTRASLLTGRNHTTVGMACVAEATTGFPGSNGHIPFETATIAEVLGERGYNTYMLGKWHCCPEDETNMASSKRNWPTGRGFERYYGYLGGETNQWYPDLVQDQQFVDQPYGPEDGYHLSKDLVDRAIAMIGDAKQVAPDRPFFMYFCPGASHAPHHAPKEWSDEYRGEFDLGYEEIRETILTRQKEIGVVPQCTSLSPINPYAERTGVDGKPWPESDTQLPWGSLSEDQKRLFARMAEVYAGFCSYTDHEIGRLIDYLEQIGELDNTLIVVISDNGASGEGGPAGSVNENKFFNGVPDDIAENVAKLDELGTEKSYNHYALGWATAFNTPFKLWKRHSYNGGVCDPMIVHWPQGVAAKGELRHQYTHVSDIVPTIYEALGIQPPAEVKGYTQWRLEGTSFLASFTHDDAPSKETQYYVMLGTRGIWHKGWKANAVHASAPSDWSHFVEDEWELFNTEDDRSECHDVAGQYPQLLEELKALWFTEAGKYSGLPLEDRGALAILTTPRPQIAPTRDQYVYYPGTLEVPEAVAVSVRGRSYKIAAEVDLDGPDAQGVLFAHGHAFGGHALYVKDGTLTYVYDYLGMEEQVVTSSSRVPTGACVLGVEFTKKSQTPQATVGSLTLYMDGRVVGERKNVRTQNGKFALCGEGLNVGRDGASPVTWDYPGSRPWAFTGGTIRRVVVNVSGKPYLDLEKEAMAVMSRD